MNRLKVLAVVALVAGVGVVSFSGWHVSAQEEVKTKTDPFLTWQYPNATRLNSLTGMETGVAHFSTSDSIDKVWDYYNKKSAPPPDNAVRWDNRSDPVKLVNQEEECAASSSFMRIERRAANGGLFVIRQPNQTVTVHFARDPDDRKKTEILIITDAR